MSYDVYKEAVMRVLPAAAEIPLESPPSTGFDLTALQICPACGSADPTVQQVEDAEIAKCPQCQCEFPPRLESVSRHIIRRISEHRQRRLNRFIEALPASLSGVDPVDYALFKDIVDDETLDVDIEGKLFNNSWRGKSHRIKKQQ